MDQELGLKEILNVTWDALIKGRAPSISNSRGDAPYVNYANDDKSHTLAADEIQAIKQTQSKGFRIIDIDPNLLSKNEFPCIYPQTTIGRMLGEDDLGYRYNVLQPVRQIDNDPGISAGSTSPYWRTVSLDLAGNFLKIEFLPARTRKVALFQTGNIQNSTSITPQNTDLIANTDQFKDAVSFEASSKEILVDFETPSNSPHLLRSTTIFNTYFSSVFLTFKQMNCQIRITVGVNSEIKTDDSRETSLHLFGGDGLTKSRRINPVTFCLSDRDTPAQTALGYRGLRIGSSPATSTMIFNPNVGVSEIFLTGFHSSMRIGDNGNGPVFVADVELVHYKTDITGSPLFSIKRLLKTEVTLMESTTATKQVGPIVHCQFNEPVRVSLNYLEGIVLRLTPILTFESVPDSYIKFSFEGYCFGGFADTREGNPPSTPFRTQVVFEEPPFPCDTDTVLLPRL